MDDGSLKCTLMLAWWGAAWLNHPAAHTFILRAAGCFTSLSSAVTA